MKGQPKEYPAIEKSVPAFKFTNAHSTQGPFVGSQELLGKFYILDFWSTSCGSCIVSFPKLNDLQVRFKDKVKIILVGLQTRHENIEKAYKKYEDALNLNLISIYDSTLFSRFVPRAIPHLIWIDDHGLVKAITSSGDLTEKNIESFLSRKTFDFRDVSAAATFKNALYKDQPVHSGSSTVFRSELRILKMGAVRDTVRDLDFYLKENYPGYRARSATAQSLLNIAFFGKVGYSYNQSDVWPWPIIEREGVNTTALLVNKYFDYFLEVPAERLEVGSLMSQMQRDLQAAFNVKATVVIQPMPYYELVVIDSGKVEQLKGRNTSFTNSWNVESKINYIVNTPLNRLPITLNNKLLEPKILMVDGTHDSSLVSLSIEANILDLESIRTGLHKLGMDLIQKQKEMLVLKLKI